jgi:tetratricopeptide (TPR) repeat protein
MAHLFVSYAHVDGKFLTILKEKLESAGFEVWYDKTFLSPGEDWRSEIDNAIRSSFGMVAVMSPAAFESKYVTYEWAYALGLGLKVVPILLEKTELHPRLSAIQYLDFTDHWSPPWDALITKLKQLEQESGAGMAQKAQELPVAERARLVQHWSTLGENQLRAQNFVGALDMYKKAADLDNNDAFLCERLGYIYTQVGAKEALLEAEKYLLHALELNPQSAPALAQLGFVYGRLGKLVPEGQERETILDKAEGHLLKALEISPTLLDEEGESWWGPLGGVYRRRGKIDEAIKAYKRAAEIKPRSYPFTNLALLYLQKKDRDAMRQTYQLAEQLATREMQNEGGNYWYYADLLVARLALGKTEEAQESLAMALLTVPADGADRLQSLAGTLRQLAEVLDTSQAEQIQQVAEHITAQAG